MLREELPEILCPADIFLPQSTAYPERDIKGITPKSIFQISNSHKARQQAELVGEYVMASIFGDPRFAAKKRVA